MMKLKCLLGHHNYQPVQQNRIEHLSHGEVEDVSTRLLVECECCGERQVRELKGSWSNEALGINKEAA